MFSLKLPAFSSYKHPTPTDRMADHARPRPTRGRKPRKHNQSILDHWCRVAGAISLPTDVSSLIDVFCRVHKLRVVRHHKTVLAVLDHWEHTEQIGSIPTDIRVLTSIFHRRTYPSMLLNIDLAANRLSELSFENGETKRVLLTNSINNFDTTIAYLKYDDLHEMQLQSTSDRRSSNSFADYDLCAIDKIECGTTMVLSIQNLTSCHAPGILVPIYDDSPIGDPAVITLVGNHANAIVVISAFSKHILFCPINRKRKLHWYKTCIPRHPSCAHYWVHNTRVNLLRHDNNVSIFVWIGDCFFMYQFVIDFNGDDLGFSEGSWSTAFCSTFLNWMVGSTDVVCTVWKKKQQVLLVGSSSRSKCVEVVFFDILNGRFADKIVTEISAWDAPLAGGVDSMSGKLFIYNQNRMWVYEEDEQIFNAVSWFPVDDQKEVVFVPET